MDYLRSKLSKHRNQRQASSSSKAYDNNQSGNGLTIEYFQMKLILDCLMRIIYNPSDHRDFLTMCMEQFQDNEQDSHMLHDFERKYSSERSLWWYLQDCFLYKILNYSLESQDIGNLLLCRQILHDIEQQIVQNRCSTPLHVYRCQLMSTELLDKWVTSVGQCVVVNSFLSTTTNPDVIRSFLNNNQTIKENHERVILEIDADSRILGSKPFVQVGSLNYSGDKDEVIFMFGSIFLINNITCGNDGIYTIEMTLYSDNENELKQVFDDMKTKYGDGEINLFTFSQLLYDLGRFSEAEEYANRYLQQLSPDHKDTIRCYDFLGLVSLAKKNFESSLNWYNKSLELQLRKLPKLGDPKIADTHENIADVYWKQGSYDLALKHYGNSLEIKKGILPSQHPSIAATLENMGRIFESKKDFSQALSYFQKASSIYRQASSSISHDKISQIDEHIRRISHNIH